MRKPLIAVLRNKYTLGWGGLLGADNEPVGVDKENKQHRLTGLPVTEASEAISAKYSVDAHFVPYYALDENGEPLPAIYRLQRHVLDKVRADGTQVLIDLMVFDVDDDVAHKFNRANPHQTMPARAEWRSEVLGYAEKLPWVEELSLYNTKGGFRLIFRLPEPLRPEHYEQAHYAFGEALTRRGVIIDQACKDWTRCYRLPFVVRDQKPQEADTCILDNLCVPMTWPIPDYVPGLIPGRGRRDRSGQVVNAEGSIMKGLGQAGPLQVPAVIDENRNVMLMRIGGQLRRNGMEDAVLYFALAGVNNERCQPPLGDEEVRGIARSLHRYEPDAVAAAAVAKAAETPAPSDAGHAPTLATPTNAPLRVKRPSKATPVPKGDRPIDEDGSGRGPEPESPNGAKFQIGSETEISAVALDDLEHGGTLFVHDRGRLWQYDGGCGIWRRFVRAKFQRQIMRYDGEWVYLGQDKKTGGDRYGVLKVGNKTTINCAELAAVHRHAPNFFDNARDGLAFANGFVSVSEDGEITKEDFDPEHRATAFLPINIELDAEHPEIFLNFLDEVFQNAADKAGLIQLVREFFGAALIGRTTRFQKAMVFIGEGANGKSTLQEIIAACFDASSITSVTPQSLDSEYNRALLVGSKLNTISELPEADILGSESVKALIRGDSMNAREIRQEPFRFRPNSAQIWSANTLPAVRDMTHGFWRSFIVVPFDRVFTPEEQIPGLSAQLIDAELAQIVMWALQGAAELCKRGHYCVPDSAEAALKGWQDGADQVQLFVEDTFERVTVADGMAADKVYNLYKNWAEQNGHAKISSTSLGKRVKLMNVAVTRFARGKVYGLKVKPLSVATVATSVH